MIIITQPYATDEQIERIVARVREFGLEPQINRGASRVIIGVVGAEDLAREKPLAAMPGVEAIVPVFQAVQARLRRISRASRIVRRDRRRRAWATRKTSLSFPDLAQWKAANRFFPSRAP